MKKSNRSSVSEIFLGIEKIQLKPVNLAEILYLRKKLECGEQVHR